VLAPAAEAPWPLRAPVASAVPTFLGGHFGLSPFRGATHGVPACAPFCTLTACSKCCTPQSQSPPHGLPPPKAASPEADTASAAGSAAVYPQGTGDAQLEHGATAAASEQVSGPNGAPANGASRTANGRKVPFESNDPYMYLAGALRGPGGGACPQAPLHPLSLPWPWIGQRQTAVRQTCPMGSWLLNRRMDTLTTGPPMAAPMELAPLTWRLCSLVRQRHTRAHQRVHQFRRPWWRRSRLRQRQW